MVKRKMKTLKRYLLKGNILNKAFIDRDTNKLYRILDIRDGRACGFDFFYIHIHYLDKQYQEGESDIRSLNLGLEDLEAIVETEKVITL